MASGPESSPGSRFLTGAARALARGVAQPAARLSSLLSLERIAGTSVRVERDLPYAPDASRSHRLDIYRDERATGLRPLVVYIHGGGFQTLSKDTHWLIALPFARDGFVVAALNYRLAPQYPFPAALVDCVRALEWLAPRAAAFGADFGRLAFAGESAGANLALALTVMACFQRDDPWSARLHALGAAPSALVSYYGLLQVSDPGRFQRGNPRVPAWAHRQITNVSRGYLRVDPRLPRGMLELADPLVVLERLRRPSRPVPACFAAVGVRDPLLPDTRRLVEAIAHHGAAAQGRYYPGQLHGFHALARPSVVRQCERDTFEFLRKQL